MGRVTPAPPKAHDYGAAMTVDSYQFGGPGHLHAASGRRRRRSPLGRCTTPSLSAAHVRFKGDWVQLGWCLSDQPSKFGRLSGPPVWGPGLAPAGYPSVFAAALHQSQRWCSPNRCHAIVRRAATWYICHFPGRRRLSPVWPPAAGCFT